MSRPIAALLSGLAAVALVPAGVLLFGNDLGLLHWLAAVALAWMAARFSERVAGETVTPPLSPRRERLLARAGRSLALLGFVVAATAPIWGFALGEYLWARAHFAYATALTTAGRVRDAELQIGRSAGFYVGLECLSDASRGQAGTPPVARVDTAAVTRSGRYDVQFHGLPAAAGGGRLSAFVYYASPSGWRREPRTAEIGVCADSEGRLCWAAYGAPPDVARARCPSSCRDMEPSPHPSASEAPSRAR